MAKRVTEVQVHASETDRVEDEHLDVSVDLIDERLYLGNLACARDNNTLEKLGITHILTIDVVPLPRIVLDRVKLIFKYVQLADVPKEDLISHLPECINYIKESIENGGTILVHCYFGVSRSAAVVVGYIMQKYGLCFEEAFDLVKSKRRFIHPNAGFVAQLKLYGHMGFKINNDDPRYKQFRLKMAGQKWKQVKILPQLFVDLIKPDPGLTRERPDPMVYRCKKCRRVVASQSNIIPHIPKQIKVELAKKGVRPPPSNLIGLNCAENGQILIEKLKNLACQIMEGPQNSREESNSSDETYSGQIDIHEEGTSQPADFSDVHLVDTSILPRADAPENCRQMWFVEPMSWMKGVQTSSHGKLHCPKCANKIGSFSWIMGCKCPCGQKVAPAFYLVPSKVEWSNIVQNVQITV